MAQILNGIGPCENKDMDLMFQVSCEHGDTGVIEQLLADNPTYNLKNGLLSASSSNNIEIVKMLLEFDVRNPNALKMASYYGYFEIVQLLINHGVTHEDALYLAASEGHYQIVLLLLTHGYRDPRALCFSANNRFTSIVYILLMYGVRDNAALRGPSRNNYENIVWMLLDFGLVDDEALAYATICSNINIMKMLMDKGALIQNEALELVQHIAMFNADDDIQSLLSVMSEKNHDNIRKLLLQFPTIPSGIIIDYI